MPGKRFRWGFLLLALSCSGAQAVTFNNVVSLGDSLLDDPGGGRSPVAAEHVAARLGVPLTKFARSGSTSDDLILDGQPTEAAANFGAGDLAMLWIGGNDFFSNPFEIAFGENDFLVTLEANADLAISTLRSAGLEVAFFNLPDMSQIPGVIATVDAATILTPFLRSSAYENITDATVAWNDRLESLASTYDATVIDVFEIFGQLAVDPSPFSIFGHDPILNADTGCQFCVFFDDLLLPDVHPSSFAQGIIANEAIATLNERYVPDGLRPMEPLSIVEIGLLADVYAGDFDGDGMVDANDLAQWQTNFGGSGADADGDGDADGADFLIWQTQFQAVSTGGLGAVPEPTALTLALLPLTVYCAGRPAKS